MTDVLDTNLPGSEEVRARFRQDVCQRSSGTGHLGPSWLGSGWFRIRQSSQAITGNSSDIRADAGRMFFWRPSFRADREGEDMPREHYGWNDRGLTV